MKGPYSISSNKAEYPFAHLFRCLSPKDFVSVFGGEADQTIAFLLSFSRNRLYIKKVLRIIDDDDLADAVSHYLRNVSEQGVDPAFVSKIEKYLESSMQRWKDLASSKHLRRNIFIHGKNPVKESDTSRPKETPDNKFDAARERYLFPESLFRYINPYRRRHTVKI